MWITPLAHRFMCLAIATVVVALAATTIVSAQQAATYEIVSSFEIAEGRPNGVIQTRDGHFYGTTGGGPGATLPVTLPLPIGTIFAMNAVGARTTLHTFYLTSISGFLIATDGTPMSNLFEGADGNLYGTTYNFTDGSIPPGQIFRISPAGDFARLSGSPELRAGVIEARDGRLYGTTAGSGDPTDRFFGYVFRVEANGTLTILHRFDGTESAFPVAELLEIDDGSLYGATAGGNVFPPGSSMLQSVPPTIFRVDPVAGAFSIRYTFTDRSQPAGQLIQGSDSLIYGTTVNGGDFGLGTVFSFDRAGTLATLHHFAGDDGANPNAGVIQGADGRLYGTTTNGGAFGQGTVFVMNVTGGLTTLHDFTLSDGANPITELIEANDGAFYGAAPNGGPHDRGVVFRVRLGSSPPPSPLDGYVEIVSRNSGKCLDVSGASTDAGASAIQWVCHGGPNQQWRLEPAGGGAVRIIARHSGQVLDVFGAALDDVTPISQWPVNGGDNQMWTLEPAPDGYVRIVARHSGKAMDVEGASVDDGARVIQYTPHGNANQQWLLRPVQSTAAVTTVSTQ
jgi:uncharacterized repeat protein (TIGR03803 family)